MRVNLIATKLASSYHPAMSAIPISLLIQPARGLSGDFCHSTDSVTLLAILRLHTKLAPSVLTRFNLELGLLPSVQLSGVELSDAVLAEIGYFVD